MALLVRRLEGEASSDVFPKKSKYSETGSKITRLKQKHDLSVVGPLPLVSKGTHVIIPLVDHLEDERWEAKITEQSGNKVKLSVNSPANAVVGLYGLTVMTRSAKDEAATTHNSSKNIVMLFNPWCEGELACGRVKG